MSTVQTPPVAPPATGGGGGGGDGQVQVTRNVPPKKVQVLAPHQITYAGQNYVGGEEGNDVFVIGEGPVADQWALAGIVVILEHEAIDAWNGTEGEDTRKRAAAYLKSDASGEGKPTHDHGFVKYEHADPDNPMSMDLTAHRQQLAEEHMFHPDKPDTMSDDQAGPPKRGKS